MRSRSLALALGALGQAPLRAQVGLDLGAANRLGTLVGASRRRSISHATRPSSAASSCPRWARRNELSASSRSASAGPTAAAAASATRASASSAAARSACAASWSRRPRSASAPARRRRPAAG